MKYSTFDRELLAVYLEIRHFHLWKTEISISWWITCHPCKLILTDTPHAKPGIWTSLYNLSQTCSMSKDQPVYQLSSLELAQTQDSDSDLQRIAQNPDTCNLKLERMPYADTGYTIICDNSSGTNRPFVPAIMWHNVFPALHSLSHTGIRATQRLSVDRLKTRLLGIDSHPWRSQWYYSAWKATPKYQPIPTTDHTLLKLIQTLNQTKELRHRFQVSQRATKAGRRVQCSYTICWNWRWSTVVT